MTRVSRLSLLAALCAFGAGAHAQFATAPPAPSQLRTGFDDINFAAHSTPSLTTVRQPAPEMGAKACELLIDWIEGKARDEAVQLTRQRLAGMEEFMAVTNKIFEQFVTNAKSGLNRVVRVLLKALP